MKKHTIIAFIAGLLIGLAFTPVAMIASYANMAKNVHLTLASIEAAKTGISLYYEKTGKLPPTLAELNKNKLNIEFAPHPIKDGWGNPLRYKTSNLNLMSYELSSYGADNAPGGYLDATDITRNINLTAPANQSLE